MLWLSNYCERPKIGKKWHYLWKMIEKWMGRNYYDNFLGRGPNPAGILTIASYQCLYNCELSNFSVFFYRSSLDHTILVHRPCGNFWHNHSFIIKTCCDCSSNHFNLPFTTKFTCSQTVHQIRSWKWCSYERLLWRPGYTSINCMFPLFILVELTAFLERFPFSTFLIRNEIYLIFTNNNASCHLLSP